MAIDSSLRDTYETWTELDGDLADADTQLSHDVLKARLECCASDAPRIACWSEPENVLDFRDIPYIDDGDRGHLLDVYVPSDIRLRGGSATPVFVDIHGGGFVYGYKDLNRNFNKHLAARGFVVVSLSYRLVPRVDVVDQLSDVAAGLAWVRDHIREYWGDPGAMFLTGDSAGGALSLWSLLLMGNERACKALGVDMPDAGVKGAALVSGVFDMQSMNPEDKSIDALDVSIKQRAFTRMFSLAPDDFVDLRQAISHANLPPLFLNTSSDDFIEAESLQLAMLLSRAGKPFELHDWKVGKGECLGYVFPICLTYLPQSERTLDLIRDYAFACL